MARTLIKNFMVDKPFLSEMRDAHGNLPHPNFTQDNPGCMMYVSPSYDKTVSGGTAYKFVWGGTYYNNHSVGELANNLFRLDAPGDQAGYYLVNLNRNYIYNIDGGGWIDVYDVHNAWIDTYEMSMHEAWYITDLYLHSMANSDNDSYTAFYFSCTQNDTLTVHGWTTCSCFLLNGVTYWP